MVSEGAVHGQQPRQEHHGGWAWWSTVALLTAARKQRVRGRKPDEGLQPRACPSAGTTISTDFPSSERSGVRDKEWAAPGSTGRRFRIAHTAQESRVSV